MSFTIWSITAQWGWEGELHDYLVNYAYCLKTPFYKGTPFVNVVSIRSILTRNHPQCQTLGSFWRTGSQWVCSIVLVIQEISSPAYLISAQCYCSYERTTTRQWKFLYLEIHPSTHFQLKIFSRVCHILQHSLSPSSPKVPEKTSVAFNGGGSCGSPHLINYTLHLKDALHLLKTTASFRTEVMGPSQWRIVALIT